MNAIRGATLAITVFCIPNLFMFGEFAMSSKLIVALLAVIGVLLIAVVILLATLVGQGNAQSVRTGQTQTDGSNLLVTNTAGAATFYAKETFIFGGGLLTASPVQTQVKPGATK